MNWALFCQIEVILLTAGLIVSFIISMHQTVKDNSFFKRFGAISSALSDAMANAIKNLPNKENNDDK